jgi:L-rhamnonate dehydratase
MSLAPRIASVRALVVLGGGADYHDEGTEHRIDGQIATPMSIYLGSDVARVDLLRP